MYLENGIKIITVVELDGLPKGSVLQNCISMIDKNNDALCWSGLWCSMFGSYHVLVKQEDCEIWDEEKHDIMFFLKKQLAEKRAEREEVEERDTLARLKLKYEKE